eukprot:1784044-Rhodomonas_salina.3
MTWCIGTLWGGTDIAYGATRGGRRHRPFYPFVSTCAPGTLSAYALYSTDIAYGPIRLRDVRC